jgi:hypothetical protein
MWRLTTMERPDLALAAPTRPARGPWFTRDVLGQPVLLKRLIMTSVNLAFYPIFRWRHPLTLHGAEHLKSLPPRGVLFVSNHQTYFTDAIAMHQAFSAALSGRAEVNGPPGIHPPAPHGNVLRRGPRDHGLGLDPRLLAKRGAICVDRSWKEGETVVQREVDLTGFSDIGRALSQGWVINFPQGTTRPFAPGRPRRRPTSSAPFAPWWCPWSSRASGRPSARPA